MKSEDSPEQTSQDAQPRRDSRRSRRRSRTADAPALGPLGMLRWAWTQLTKMNTALFLLLLLAVAAVPGSIFPQNIQDPGKVQTYLEAHPTWGPIADKLQLFDVFSSVWFSAIYLLLFISLIGCVLPRAVKHAKDWRAKPPRTPRNLSRLPQHRTLTIPADSVRTADGAPLDPQTAVRTAQRILRRRRYRTDLRLDGPAPSVGAERGMVRELGNLLFHAALIGVLVGMAIGSLFGYSGQKIVVKGESFVNTLVSYDTFTPGTDFDADRLRPFSLTLDDFHVSFDRQQGSPTYAQPLDFTADVSVKDDADSKARKETLKVNQPLSVDGTRVYLSGNGYAPIVKVTDGDGKVAYEGPVVSLATDKTYTSSTVLKVPDARPDQLGFVGMFLPSAVIQDGQSPYSADPSLSNPALVLSSYSGDLGLDGGTPQNVYVLDTSSLHELNSMRNKNGIVLTEQNPKAELPEGKGSIELEGVSRYVGLDIHYDPGKPVVLVSFLLAFAGLVVSLFVARRRAWVTARATRLADGTDAVVVEYGLLARGEDPRIGAEADRLTQLFAKEWGLEFSEA
ncbi:cytochrome c biogenesis protein ResB [Rothia kristinae]|uniref:Cytochrome c biogenesis protein ResB n=1 Tax=Rothia kristinae TaxID=37923 RepID=A0A7T3CH11_9MICC|nr:cytochrome c biogenesis protein ResB [Rothia kristinae]MED6046697.1 cytochrome c biogenesis protein ResB [Rothia kristinae]QPT53978.1 cytochrome c biogenesis protein ResB [Rothia kristinae]